MAPEPPARGDEGDVDQKLLASWGVEVSGAGAAEDEAAGVEEVGSGTTTGGVLEDAGRVTDFGCWGAGLTASFCGAGTGLTASFCGAAIGASSWGVGRGCPAMTVTVYISTTSTTSALLSWRLSWR